MVKQPILATMTRETDYLIQSLFEREGMEVMTLDELKGYSHQYPFSSIIQFLYTSKLKSLHHLDFPATASKTALFFEDPFWLDYQLHDENDMGKFHLESNENRMETAEELPPLLVPIEPYHTIDYFASQGIKLSKEEEKDELGKKVKSFTAWLKTMKRLQPEPENISVKDAAVFSDSSVTALDSIEPILTESMAEVYLKQGLAEKAIEIYQKLSLQNPANSHIFASRISSIKENNI